MGHEHQSAKGMTTGRKLWIGIGILVLLSPLGILVPKWFGASGAWGEWGLDEIEKIAGFVPEGMKRLAETWKAPLTDYAVPGQRRGLLGESMGYIAAGIVGIAITASVMYILAKILSRRKGPDASDKH
jgi:cobalt/nickel transport protein